LPDTPKSTAISIPFVDLDLCGNRPSDYVVSFTPNTNVRQSIEKPFIDLDLSGILEIDGDIIILIGMWIYVSKLINGLYIIVSHNIFFCY